MPALLKRRPSPTGLLLSIIAILTLISFGILMALQDLDHSRVDRLEEPTFKKIGLSSMLSGGSRQRITYAKEPLMSPMTNATLKAELGRSAWRLLHVYVFLTSAPIFQKALSTIRKLIHSRDNQLE
jgi:hypothetical protein